MSPSAANPVIAELRERVRRFEGAGRGVRQVLPFGVDEIDRRLPGGGLMLGCLHEVAGGGSGAVDGAAAALFAAGIAARTKGKVLWCVTRPDLFAPALAQAGLPPDRVIHVEAGEEKDLLACFEEGLRHGGPGAVVAEVSRLSMTASRRLQLAAERSGATGIAIRRWRRPADAADFGQPTAAFTRWRVSVLPSAPLPVAGVGRSRWWLELVRCRGGEGFDIEVEACDAEGKLVADRVAVPAEMAHGPSRQANGRPNGRPSGRRIAPA
ncbi:ImuA family protein [Pseudochelatococcus sp. B33]